MELEHKPMDRRVRKTLKQLRKGLTDLMMEKPVKDITVRELTERCDMNRGTFYLHYRDIFDMVEKMEREFTEQFVDMIDSFTPDEMQEQSVSVLTEIFLFLKENIDVAKALLGKHGDLSFVGKIAEVIQKKCLTDWEKIYGAKNTVATFEYCSSFVTYGCIGLFINWLKHGENTPVEEMALLTRDLMFGSLARLSGNHA